MRRRGRPRSGSSSRSASSAGKKQARDERGRHLAVDFGDEVCGGVVDGVELRVDLLRKPVEGRHAEVLRGEGDVVVVGHLGLNVRERRPIADAGGANGDLRPRQTVTRAPLASLP
jgi:hypothetical protein